MYMQSFFSFVLLVLFNQTDQRVVEKLVPHAISEKKKHVKENYQAPRNDLLENLTKFNFLSLVNGNILEKTKLRKYAVLLKPKLRKNFNGPNKKFKDQRTVPHKHQKKKKDKGKKKKQMQSRVETAWWRQKRPVRSLFNPIPSGNINDQVNENSTLKERFKLVCRKERSCRGRCRHPQTVIYQSLLSCYCDVDCDFFQDCCADYDDFCGKERQSTPTDSNNTVTGQDTIQNTSPENLVSPQNRNLWRCYELGKNLDGTKGVWMIGSCPRYWPKDDVLYWCKNLSDANKITKDNYRHLPVYTKNGRVYRNRFCAQCNGVSSQKLNNFRLSINCTYLPPLHLTFDQKIQFFFRYCPKKVHLELNEWRPRRYCIKFKGVSDDKLGYAELKRRCDNGKYRVVSISATHYKSFDCARYMESSPVSCGPAASDTEFGTPKSLSVIFNFNYDPGSSSLRIKAVCDESKVYDPYLQICRDGVLPALQSASYFNQYQVLLWLQPSNKQLPNCFLQKSSITRTIRKFFKIPLERIRKLSLISFDDPNRHKLQFTVEITQNERSRVNIKRMLDFTSPFNITIAEQVFTVFKATKRIVSCVNRKKYHRDEYTVLQDGTSAVSIKKTGQVFQSTDYYTNKTTANESQAIFVCLQQHFTNCSGIYISMNTNEFTLLQNRSILVNASKQVYDWSEYAWQNNSMLVCVNFSKTYYRSYIPSHDDKLLPRVTSIFMSLSIISLVFVLVTYSLFSELRTPPGINLMNLSASILLAQLLWLLGSGQTGTPMACTFIAVVLHYLFLVSFVWTSIIAFDTWRAFSAKRRPLANQRSNKIKQCVQYFAVGWLLVIVYVAVCVVLDLTDTVNIGYRSTRACWMADKWAILYFFAVPVGLFLVLNIGFYVMTFKAIIVTTTQARAATDHDAKKNFGIYVRIASLMGFTWIFGFVAPFGWHFLWYPFVVLNSLQGVYIALAFPLSKRARNLYKKLFRSSFTTNEMEKNSISRTKTSPDAEKTNSCSDTRF